MVDPCSPVGTALSVAVARLTTGADIAADHAEHATYAALAALLAALTQAANERPGAAEAIAVAVTGAPIRRGTRRRGVASMNGDGPSAFIAAARVDAMTQDPPEVPGERR